MGHRYGSVIKTGNDSGISYTEKEFRYAKEKKIPILSFILSDEASIKKSCVETDFEKIKKLAAFKVDVKNGRYVEEWETPDELAFKVTVALYKQMTSKNHLGRIKNDSSEIREYHAKIEKLDKLVRDLQEENAKLKSRIGNQEKIYHSTQKYITRIIM